MAGSGGPFSQRTCWLHCRAVTLPRRHLSSIVRIALLAMLALALSPTLSRGITWLRGDVEAALAQVCTPQGAKRLDAAPGKPASPLPLRADASLDACAYCVQLAAGGVPGERALAHPGFTQQRAQPPALSAPSLRSGWRAPPPRAPPAQG